MKLKELSFKLNKFVSQSKFIRMGFLQNTWISFHMLLAAIGVRILQETSLSSLYVFGIILISAILFEVIEERIENPTKKLKKEIYGSIEKWKYDTAGDIVSVLIISALMLW